MVRRQSATESDIAPPHLPDSRPPIYQNHDHSFTLQTVMEMQKSVGQLTEAVCALRSSIDKQSNRMEKLEDKLSDVTHKLYAAGVILVALLAFGGFIVDKAWDLMVDQIKTHQPQNH